MVSRKRFAEAVEKIEDQRLLDLDFLFRALELRGCGAVARAQR